MNHRLQRKGVTTNDLKMKAKKKKDEGNHDIIAISK